MPRAVRIVSVVALALLLVGCARQAPEGPKRIAISVTCPPADSEGNMTIQIHPATAVVAPGQAATFELSVQGPGGQGIRITAEDPGTWPYAQTELTDDSGTVTFSGMSDDEPDGTHDYEIGFRCYDRDLTLDPRVIVKG